MTQETALAILKTGANVFLTGEPGSGKTHAVRAYVQYLRDRGVEPAVTASTGIAATHLHGMTLHSWSGIGIKKRLSTHDVAAIVRKPRVSQRIGRTSVLIIDEVSMLDASTLDAADAVCRAAKKNSAAAFGGMQVVLVGDFFQLPPVVQAGEPPALFAFDATAWRDARPVICYLSEQYRQDDRDFLSVLSAIRSDTYTAFHDARVRSRLGAHESVAGNVPRLFSHNVDVDALNAKRLAEIRGKESVFTMAASGPSVLVETLQRGCLSPETLALKIGAVAMCTKNNLAAGFVNGTLGAVVGFGEETGYPIIETRAGRPIEVTPMEWTLEENGHVRARITQVPLRLAWAITIHKSQGMSMDAAVMNLSDVFEYGQGYVALSRVRRFSGLYLQGYHKTALKVHPLILAKDVEFRSLSAAARARFDGADRTGLEVLRQQFIRACGGKHVAEKPDQVDGTNGKAFQKIRAQHPQRLSVVGRGR